MNETGIIYWHASHGSKLSDLSRDLHYSERHANRLCWKFFGKNYQGLKNVLKLSRVLRQILETGTLLTVQEYSDEPAVRKFIRKQFSGTITEILGGQKMSEYLIIQEVANALRLLSNTDQCISQKTLGISDQTVIQMRKEGFPLVSLPGPKGGYTLNREKAAASEAWINHWRCSVGITTGEFSYSHFR